MPETAGGPDVEPVRTAHDRGVAGLHVAEWPGSGPTVLCLPGLTSTARIWTPLARTLPDARLLALDLRGRGLSLRATGPTGLSAHADDVARVAVELDLRDVVLVGHSMGGYLAGVAAARMGDRVRRLVLLDGGLPPALPAVLGPRLTRLLFRKDLRKLNKDWPDPSTFATAVLGRALDNRPDLRDELVALAAHDLLGPTGRLRAQIDTRRAVDDAVDTFFGADVDPALEALDVPVHLVAAAHGKHDRAKPFLSDAVLQAWQARMPTLTTERVPDNHLTILFSPAVARAVEGTGA